MRSWTPTDLETLVETLGTLGHPFVSEPQALDTH